MNVTRFTKQHLATVAVAYSLLVLAAPSSARDHRLRATSSLYYIVSGYIIVHHMIVHYIIYCMILHYII